MKIPFLLITCLLITLSACTPPADVTYPEIQIAGAMKNVMWKGELDAIIQLDDIADKEGLYAIGPLSGLRGEILIFDGTAYVSRVSADTSISVEETYQAGAPFLVYGHVTKWKETELPDHVTDLASLEAYVDENTRNYQRPFLFQLSGEVASADIHIQNLPEGTPVSSPSEAHQGQVNYPLENKSVEIVGFFSTEHQGVFTHHDTYLHLHLLTTDRKQMGHLDRVTFEPSRMKLFLPQG
jgi:acetolactate decarboxylase